MKITATKTAVAGALAIILLSPICWWHFATEGPKLLLDANGDPMLPMPFHHAEPGANIPIFDAQDVLRAFHDNIEAANQKYGGRVWLNGTVTEISGPTITLEGSAGIHCVYVSIQEQARMVIGQKVTIEGGLGGSKERITLFRPCKRLSR